PAFSRCHPSDDPGTVLQHLARVERALPARDALHQEPGVLVGEDAHAASLASCTTRATASSMSLSAVIPTALRIRMASAAWGPVSRITIGPSTLNWRVAAPIPLATWSVRVMPPKMLNRIAFTCGSA